MGNKKSKKQKQLDNIHINKLQFEFDQYIWSQYLLFLRSSFEFNSFNRFTLNFNSYPNWIEVLDLTNNFISPCNSKIKLVIDQSSISDRNDGQIAKSYIPSFFKHKLLKFLNNSQTKYDVFILVLGWHELTTDL